MGLAGMYAKIQQQLDTQLPFVGYRKANEDLFTSFLQKDDSLHVVNDYNAEGFIFAPFDHSRDAILIPVAESECLTASITVPTQKTNSEYVGDGLYDAVNQSFKKEHIHRVTKAIDTIHSEVFRKVVLSRAEEIHLSDTYRELEIFKQLIDLYPTAFVYIWYHPKVGLWLGATPETLLYVKGNQLTTMALAGTLPYKDHQDVVWGKKELEEQEMVTDYILRGLKPISHTVVSSKAYTYRAGTLLHLRTDIKASIDDKNTTIGDVVKILHPTPAVCGFPKKEAYRYIIANEGYDRTFYTGFLGELNIGDKNSAVSNLFVNLRCMQLEKDKAVLYIGGGITKDSDPEKEWEETVRKTETMKRVLAL